MSSKKEKIQSTIKSTDTEENIDIYWTRPIGYMWAKFFERLGVHPNTVTIISMFLGAGAGICFFFDSYRLAGLDGLYINILGVLLLAWANFYDSADGQLARMTGKKTKLGRILDGAAGDVWYIFIYLSLVFRMWRYWEPDMQIFGYTIDYVIWCIIVFAYVAFDGFLCHPGQCRISDYYRNIHLLFLKGKNQSEADTYEVQKQIYDNLSWKKDFIEKFFQFFYKNWCKGQAKDTPQLQRLLNNLRAKYGEDIPQEFRDRFRTLSFPVLKWTNALTFNWRAIFLYISCLLDLPWLVIAVEIVVFSAIRLHMIHYHEGFCKKLADELE
jgi:phosphatidylglycerophosphate synthase